MKVTTCETFSVQIFMSGSIETAANVIRAAVFPPNPGLCVTLDPTKYIYTGGEESGFIVTLRLYPRFPSTKEELLARAEVLAQKLLANLHQWSALIVPSDGQTQYLSLRD